MTINVPSWSKRNIMVTAILIILAVAVYNWFVTPHAQYLMAAQKYEQTIDSIDRRGKILSSELQVRRKKLESLSNKYQQQKQSFFNIDQAKDFLSSLQATAEKCGCTVENLKLLPSRGVEAKGSGDVDIRQYQANLSLMGGYGNIVKFLNTIQNRPEKVWLDSLNVNMKNSENGYLGCDVTLTICTLKVKESTENVNNKRK